MHRLRILLFASSLLMAACGGGAVLSSTSEKPASLAAGSVQVNSGANASDLGNNDVSRVNPPVGKPGVGTAPPPTRPQAQTLLPAAPPAGLVVDRCSTGSGTGGNAPTPQGGKEPPQPMCAPQ